MSRFGLATRRQAGKQKESSIPLLISFLFKKVVVCGHRLVILSLTVNKTWLSSLPIICRSHSGGDGVAIYARCT